MSRYQFFFTNNESTEVECDGLEFDGSGYVHAIVGEEIKLTVPRERLNYTKKLS